MKDNYLKVEGYSHLIRDPNTNAIINTDTKSYNYYVNARNAKRQELNRINEIETNVNDLKNNLNELKSDISDIKNLLRSVLNDGS